MPLNVIGITTLSIVFLNIVLGILVLVKNPRRSNNIVYAISVSSIAIWTLFTYFYNNPVFLDPVDWLKAVYLSSYWMLIAQMIFAFYFPRKISRRFIYYIIPILITLIPSFYVLMINDTVVVSAENYPEMFLSVAEMGEGYLLYTLPNILGILLLAIYFLRKSKLFIGYEKAQVQFYILGALIMMVPLVIVDYGIPLLTGDTSFFVYGPLFAIPFSIAVAYSILKNRFLTITSILRKSLYFISVLIYVLLALIVFLNFYNRGYFHGPENYITIGIYCSLAIVLYMFLYQPVFKVVLNTFSQDERNKEEILNGFSQVSNIELTIDRIVVNTKRTIKQVFMIEKVGLILFDKRDFSIRYKYLTDFGNLSPEHLLQTVRSWDDISRDTIIVSDEVRREMILDEDRVDQRLLGVIDFMHTSEISSIIPFNSRTQLNGVLLLGYRTDKYPLSIDEIDLLEKMTANVSVSIGRAVLYQEVQVFSQTLQQKVNEQTKELQIKVEQLEEARRKENDMIDIMGHELRTPATVVKLNASFLTKFIDEVQSDPEGYKKYVKRIQDAIENEIKLINTLLSSAKLEGDKIELNPEEIDIRQEIEMALHGNEQEAIDKGLTLINQTDPNTPSIYADKARIVEVLNNLISNAIKYTENGGVGIITRYDDDFVRVSVSDTGKGIPKEDIPKLGQKFYRVNTYIESSEDDQVGVIRPGGTGLGLYVTFSLVKKMGGEITVTSEVGKGSTFTFSIPRFKGQSTPVTVKSSSNMFERLGLVKGKA